MLRLAAAVGLSLMAGAAQAGPTDAIAEKAARFCAETEAGKRYPSTAACLEAQKEGAAIVQNALDQGHAHVPMGCVMMGRQKDGQVDFALAGRCVMNFAPE